MVQLLLLCWLLVSAWAWVQPPSTRHKERQLWTLSATSSSPASSSSSSASSVRPAKGDVVVVDCRLRPEGDFIPEPLIDGVVLHDSDPPQRLVFMLGYGNYLPGLHETIADLTVGESVESVSLDAGWGARNPNLVAELQFAALAGVDRASINVGVELMLANGMRCTVVAVGDETFTIDANPPLAGASYAADVTLVAVDKGPKLAPYPVVDDSKYEAATFALGCFWGGELAFMREPGVVGTAVGYTQGSVVQPSYQEVCSGTTGHTEAIAVFYDPSVIEYERLVHLAMDRLGENKFLLNQVGNDKGTQYRHGVYYHTDAQKAIAEKMIKSYGEDCVTECLPAKEFYFAEDYHQQYLLKGGQSARKGEHEVIRCYG